MLTDRRKGKLVLADGSCFGGLLIGGGDLPVWGEVVFNTSMTGYQEIFTDPSYAGQIVVMTYPQIGNYGVAVGDDERDFCAARGLVVRDLSPFFSPGPGRSCLEAFMKEHAIPGLTEVDTRAVALRIRREGAVMGVVGSAEHSNDELRDLARSKAAAREDRLVESVSTLSAVHTGCSGRAALIDLGVKNNIVESVKKLGVEAHVLSARFDVAEILSGDFDFVVLSNGPGDPTDVPEVIDKVRRLIGRVPILGICLGHQLVALAMGGSTYKLKFGHRGANQPVKCHRNGRVYITSQNHGYAVADDLADSTGAEITFTNLNDGTLEGFAHAGLMIECVQFHPEASPGPHDTSFIFDEFLNRVKGRRDGQAI